MSKAPIDVLLDRVEWGCVKCGAKSGTCGCWIKLRCPMCGKEKTAERDPTDPPNTARIEVPCDKCDDGGLKSEVNYFNAAGQHIDCDEGLPLSGR